MDGAQAPGHVEVLGTNKQINFTVVVITSVWGPAR